MFKLIKWLIGLAFLIGVLAIAAVFVFMSIGPIIKKGIETAGPKITQVDVGVSDVKVSPFSGAGTILGLRVGNPSGYATPHAIASDEVSIEIVPSSLKQDKIIVRSIVVTSPEITFEGGLKKNNLNQIMENIQATLDKLPSDPKTDETEKAARKIQVDRISITGSKVNLSTPLLKGQSLSLPLPDIRLENLGTGPEGITVAEMVKRVGSEIFTKALGAAAEKLGDVGGLIESTTEKAADIMDQTKQIGEGVKKLFKRD